jgi:hypothetical protein
MQNTSPLRLAECLRIAANVLQLTEVGDYEAQKLEYKNNV